jgi:hypothetical protein
MLRGYAAGALYRLECHGQHTDVREFIDEVRSAGQDLFEPVGVGTSLRVNGDQTAGAALLYDETRVHFSLFTNTEANDPNDDDTRPLSPPMDRTAPPEQSQQSQQSDSTPSRRRPWWRIWG